MSDVTPAKDTADVAIKLLKSLCADIDAMRNGDEVFGPFEENYLLDDNTSQVAWPNLAILRDEIKAKLGF